MEMNLKTKQQQFNDAMKRYDEKIRYKVFNKFISISNVSMQLLLAYIVFTQYEFSMILLVVSLIVAYLLTDFVNGLIHMYMDNNDNYKSIVDPFIASFHLHHKSPRYKNNNLIWVYFNESGAKIWLVPFLILTLVISKIFIINTFIIYTICFFTIISSIAEVSHYLCHNSTSKLTFFLENIRVLMPKRHHAKHHLTDNTNYAFLNGLTDPFINFIANKLYKGYKNGTDKHYLEYKGAGSANR
jgi:Lipid desaturase domain